MTAEKYASDIAFTPTVKAMQLRRGSRGAYAHMEEAGSWKTHITPDLAAFISEQRSVFLATVNAAGQPYIQHRGGPPGFLRVLDEETLGFVDFSGNRQFISTGNLSENPKAHLFLIDYRHRKRVKVWGEARVVAADADLLARLMPEGYKARPEQIMLFTVSAWDANCPQHIPPRYEAADVLAALSEKDQRIAALEVELKEMHEASVVKMMQEAEVHRLVSELKVSNAELSRLREAADQRLQEGSMFFAAASHDLGQRLHGLKLLASAASSVGHTADAVVTRRMQEALAELDHYARHILDFAHLESGDYPVVLQRVFLQDLFQQIALNFEANADEHGIELRVRTCNFELVCDPRLLLRVLENLVANAIKFSRKGVLLAARRRAGEYCIEVWDQGPGIPSEALVEIFKPFCRLPDGTEHSTRGFGLGLATARRLAELQGMHIGVRSTLGRGTVFSVGRQV